MKYEIKCPYCGNNQIYQPRKNPPKLPHTKCKECKREFNFKVDNPDKTIVEKVPKPHDQKPAIFDNSIFIDDPNELLMSCAIRVLNKENPDVRWGTILVNILKETKQLEAINYDRDEIQSKLKQYSTEDLVKLRKKLTGNLQIDG